MDPLLELVLKLVGYAGTAVLGWVAYRQHQGKTALRAQLEQVTTARLTAQRDNTAQHLVNVFSEDTLQRLRRAETRGDELQRDLLATTRELGAARSEVVSLRALAGDLQRQNLDQQATIERLSSDLAAERAKLERLTAELAEERGSVGALVDEMVTLRRSMQGSRSASLDVPPLPALDAALERMKTNPPPPPPPPG